MSERTRVEWTSSSPAETLSLGEKIGRDLQAGDIVVLTGTLGAGKTILAQGIALGMGVTEPVTSSTFVLATPYEGARGEWWHIDAYRMKDLSEVDDLGLDELVERGARLVIEWGERIEPALPYVTWRVEIECVGESERVLRITRRTPSSSRD